MKGAARMGVLVRLAKLEEDRALQALALALREHRALERATGDAARRVAAAEELQTFSTAVSAWAAGQAFRHTRSSREDEAALRLELTRSSQELERARAALAQAKLRVRAMEKVRDRRARTEARKRQRALDARLDDAVASEHTRRRHSHA